MIYNFNFTPRPPNNPNCKALYVIFRQTLQSEDLDQRAEMNSGNPGWTGVKFEYNFYWDILVDTRVGFYQCYHDIK